VTTGYDERLDPDECRRLLASRTVARIAFRADSGDVLVLPVTYTIEGSGMLVFRTSRDGLLSQLARGESVSVQVDDVSEDLRNGWSVLAHGHAGPYEGEVSLESWVVGHDQLLIGITLERLSGRAVAG
jgi:nitroimidazol reductase NimA-like FMN-containing flavoprotein (pyridoxamine 5'-phosphate oxidase superfamily)